MVATSTEWRVSRRARPCFRIGSTHFATSGPARRAKTAYREPISRPCNSVSFNPTGSAKQEGPRASLRGPALRIAVPPLANCGTVEAPADSGATRRRILPMTPLPQSSHAPRRDVLLPGTPVRARGLNWEVVYSEPAGEQSRYRLRCTEGSLRGREIDLLSPFETVEAVAAALEPKRAGRLEEWLLYHQAFLLEQALGPSALLAIQPGRLDIAPYQLVPVMRAISLSRPRLLLADGVGLGKTIETGLVIAELIARRRAHRVLIVSPAGPLMQQWHDEMRHRFGLRFEPIRDSSTIQEKRRELSLGANPFDHVSLCLLSIDFAKQEKVMLDLERSTWDLVVIDEAHHVNRVKGAGAGEDSRRRHLAELLARQSDGLLLLTATPHDGYDEHFASLLELLDPSLLDGRGAIRGHTYQRHVIRRLKSHIKKPGTNEPLFRERVVIPRPVEFSEQSHARFAGLQRGLLTLIAPRLKHAARRRQYGDVLAFISLLKRSVSTVRASEGTLEVLADRYAELLERGTEEQEARRQRLKTLNDYRRRLDRYGALSVEEELDQAALEAEDMAASLLGEAPANLDQLDALVKSLKLERRRDLSRAKSVDATLKGLEDLVLLAEAADGEDPKLAALVAQIQELRSAEPGANVLVYTEYADSQKAAVEALNRATENSVITGGVLAIEGDDPEAARARHIERFRREDDLILVSTDATAEGLNLHARCHHLIHLELPYNPNRLEQRNGRIDRYGQERDPVVRYLYLAGTFEERVLLRLVAKYERQRARLTFVPNTLGLVVNDQSSLTQKLLDGLAEEDGSLFAREPQTSALFRFESQEPDNQSSAAYQALLDEMDSAIGGFERASKSNGWLITEGLSAETEKLQDAVLAQQSGARLGGIDLVKFVCSALQSEAKSAAVVQNLEPTVIGLELPPTWIHGLSGLPGFDSERRRLLLTTDPERLRTDAGDSVGYLGRAHPVVRRALDRVFALAAQSDAQILDRRVSAARGDEQALVFTFLGVVRSGQGREFERVLAVRVTPTGEPEALLEPKEWLSGVLQPVPTKELWEKRFASWGGGQEERCRLVAERFFAELADQFRREFEVELTQEQRELSVWLAERVRDVCGERNAQLSLTVPNLELPVWQTATDPAERLASFKADSTQPQNRRREADGVLQLYRKRSEQTARRGQLDSLPLMTIGLLMVVSEASN